jgi:1-deoxy-D-xylulose-5-phosphate reductoisomerase
MRIGGSAPAIYNAANEIAVERFLAKELTFLEIPKVIAHTLDQVDPAPARDLEHLLTIDTEARLVAQNYRNVEH